MGILAALAAAFLWTEVVVWYKEKPSERRRPISISRSIIRSTFTVNALEAVATLVLWSQSRSRISTVAACALIVSQTIFVMDMYTDEGRLHTPNKLHVAIWPFLQTGAIIALLFL